MKYSQISSKWSSKICQNEGRKCTWKCVSSYLVDFVICTGDTGDSVCITGDSDKIIQEGWHRWHCSLYTESFYPIFFIIYTKYNALKITNKVWIRKGETFDP